MKVLAINCGSSTLKFQVIELEGEAAAGRERRLASGTVDRIGGRAAIEFTAENGERLQEAAPVADHGEATQRVLVWLGSCGFLEPDGLGAIGHRVVHGGEQFVEPTLIDDEAMDAIEAVSDLAPLHNEPSLRAIRAARSALGPAIPMVAIFDTAFTAPCRSGPLGTPSPRSWRQSIASGATASTGSPTAT
jgi:acetate kinase